MIRIAICDDEKEAASRHEDIVKNSLQSCGIGYEITTYTQGNNLLCDITDDNFSHDLLLLEFFLSSLCVFISMLSNSPHVKRIPVARYACCDCGYVENWVETQKERDEIRHTFG